MAVVGNIDIGVRLLTGNLSKSVRFAQGAISGFASSAITKFGALGAAISGFAGVASITALVANSMQAIDEIGDASQKLGILPEQLSSLGFAAKVSSTDQETLIASLGKLNKVMGDAQLGSKAAQQAFAQIGLDAGQFTNVADALPAIADKIAGIQNPAQAAAAAMGLFGKQGAELLPFLQQGSAGIAALQQRAAELGIVVDSVQVAKVAAANDAIDELKTAIVGVGHAIAIQVAPFVTYFAEQLTNSGFIGQDAAKWIVAGMEYIAVGIAYGIDSLKFFEGAWHLLIAAGSMAWTVLGGAATLGVALIAASVNGLLEFFGFSRSEMLDTAAKDVAEFTNVMNQQATAEWGKAMDAFNKPSAVDGVTNFFDGIKKGADEAAKATTKAAQPVAVLSDEMLKLGDDVASLTDQWKLQAATMGMSSREAEIFKLAQAGASKEQLAELKSLNAELTKQEKLQELMDQGKELTDSLKTPMEKYQDEIAKLQELFAAGAIDEETLNRGMKKAKDEAGGTGEVKLAGAARAGSTEAFSTLARAANMGKNDPMRELNRTAEEQLAETKETNRLLRTVSSASESDVLAA